MASSSGIKFLRPYKDEDYGIFSSWWPDSTPPKEALPKIGLVYKDMHAVGFLANTDTCFGIICWYLCDPSLPPRQKHEAMSHLFQGLTGVAGALGKTYVFCFTNHKASIKILERQGFLQLERGHMAARVSA